MTTGTGHRSLRYREGDSVWTRYGGRPYWSGKSLEVDAQQDKCQVHLFSLGDIIQIKLDKLVLLTEKSIGKNGKPRRRNSHLRGAFERAMIEVRDDIELTSPDVSRSRAAESGDTQEDPELALDVFLSASMVKIILKL